MATIDIKQLGMAKRVYNNKMEVEKDKEGNIIAGDEMALTKLVNSAFTKDGEINNYQAFRDLNKLILVGAEEFGQADYQKVISMVADYERVGANDIKIYELPKEKVKATMKLTATGSGVDFTRIPSYKNTELATPVKHQFGVYYNVSRMISDPVNEYKNAVDIVREEKVKYILSKIYSVASAAATAGKIPAQQIHTDANMTFPDFRSIESSLIRYGRNTRPVLIADPAFISNLVDKQATVNVNDNISKYLTDDLREKLLSATTFETVGRTICINLDNPYTDKMNSKVDLPVNEAIMIAGGSSSPFKVTEFGGLTMLEDTLNQNIETEQVHLKISYKVDVTLLLTQAIAYLKDTAVKL